MLSTWRYGLLLLLAGGCAQLGQGQSDAMPGGVQNVSQHTTSEPTIHKSDAEWKKELTPDQYRILREKGTEPAFTGKFWNNHEQGVYACAACGAELFSSRTKFNSGTGWPSFWDAIDKNRVKLVRDTSYGMDRVEVDCARCGGHLGHLFEDGPKPTGERYCINSASLAFKHEHHAPPKPEKGAHHG